LPNPIHLLSSLLSVLTLPLTRSAFLRAIGLNGLFGPNQQALLERRPRHVANLPPS
jgi:hypothetical protein